MRVLKSALLWAVLATVASAEEAAPTLDIASNGFILMSAMLVLLCQFRVLAYSTVA